jgi:hypothetical protein
MSRNNRTSRVAGDQHLIDGLKKHFPKGVSFTVAGKKYTLSQVVSLLQARIDATRSTSVAQEAWISTAEAERTMISETHPVLEGVRATLLTTLDPSQVPLSDFGIAPRRTAATLTTKEQGDRITKWRATREARHTLGRKQKAKIKGAVPVTPPEAPANGVPPVTPHTS